MTDPTVTYETRTDQTTRFWIKGGNGEVMCRSEWYANPSNARRGFNDLVQAVVFLGPADEQQLEPDLPPAA